MSSFTIDQTNAQWKPDALKFEPTSGAPSGSQYYDLYTIGRSGGDNFYENFSYGNWSGSHHYGVKQTGNIWEDIGQDFPYWLLATSSTSVPTVPTSQTSQDVCSLVNREFLREHVLEIRTTIQKL